MNESFQLAKMTLRATFATRQYNPSPLGRLLAQNCRDDNEFEDVESAVLLNWSLGPVPVFRLNAEGDEEEIVSRDVLDELVGATLREVLRLSRGVRDEVLVGSIPRFVADERTLYLADEPVAEWRDQDPRNRAQIDILEAFQRENWKRSVRCPAATGYSFTDARKNLNRKLRKLNVRLRFRHSDDLLFWSRV
jgi:hypothetical protein